MLGEVQARPAAYSTGKKLLALAEVLCVRAVAFGLGVALFLSPLREWQLETFGFYYGTHLIFLIVPVVWLLATRRPLAAYGITGAHWRADLTAALTCLFPVFLTGASLGFLPYTRWWGALIEAAIQVGLLLILARLLNGKPNSSAGVWTLALALVMFEGYSYWQGLFPGVGRALAGFVYYLAFVGLGEELLNRGYVQSRLNEVFGRPYRLLGIEWGWGLIVASLLFGLSHVLNGWNPLTGEFQPQWWWALWTSVGGLVFGYVREKTGSIVAPALLHGLPQAIIALLMGLPGAAG